jgi:preprotein translocase subunit SecB
MSEGKPSLPLSPIQLRKIDVGAIDYRCDGFSDPALIPTQTFGLSSGISPFNEADSTFQINLHFKTESSPPDSQLQYPYRLAITIHGEFAIDPSARSKFTDDFIRSWASKNGTLLLLPFLRETVYTITQKTGFRPLLLPMVETSAFGVRPPESRMGTPVLSDVTQQP